MNDEMIALTVNEPYPFPLPPSEGAIADFLRPAGNRLLIAMHGIDQREAKSLRRGQIRAGILCENGAIMFVWRFFDKSDRPVITLDSPFDARIIPDIQLYSIDNAEQRLVIDCHIVDTSTGLVRGLREVTLPPMMTVNFLSAVQDQLAAPGGCDEQLAIWMQQSPDQLMSATKTYKIGS